MATLLDSRGRKLLYKAESRVSLEYSCLAWGGEIPTHFVVLDKIQWRAERLIRNGLPEQQASSASCTAYSTEGTWLASPLSSRCKSNGHLTCRNSVCLLAALRCLPKQSPWLYRCHTQSTNKDHSSRRTCSGGISFWDRTSAQTTLACVEA